MGTTEVILEEGKSAGLQGLSCLVFVCPQFVMSIVSSRVCHNKYLSVYILLRLVLVLGLAIPSVCLSMVWYSIFVCMCVYVYIYLYVFFVCIHVYQCLCGLCIIMCEFVFVCALVCAVVCACVCLYKSYKDQRSSVSKHVRISLCLSLCIYICHKVRVLQLIDLLFLQYFINHIDSRLSMKLVNSFMN